MKKQTVTKAQQAEFQRGWRERNQRLKEIKLPKETFEQYMEWLYGRGKKTKSGYNPGRVTKTPYKAETVHSSPQENTDSDQATAKPSSGRQQSKWSSGAPAAQSKPPSVYTGSQVIGIAVLHKSCLQPIFSQEEAIEVAKMRR
jgi:hypothetical protein